MDRGYDDGYPSWEHRVVSLWVSNDEDLYNAALKYDRMGFVVFLKTAMPLTPDGVVVSRELAEYAWDTVNEEN